jgi:hypothetical protein
MRRQSWDLNYAETELRKIKNWIKQRRISFVLGYLRMILWKISTAISIEHRILAIFNIKTKFNSDSLYAEESTWHKSNRGKTKTLTDSIRKRHKKENSVKLCVKIKKRCYTDLLHFSTRKHNLVFFFGRIENKTATYFLRFRLFTYDIMKNFNCN